jgi:hypothetical protein
MPSARTVVQVMSDGDDPLESVRRVLGFADAMVDLGADVSVVGDLSIVVRLPALPEDDDEGDADA